MDLVMDSEERLNSSIFDAFVTFDYSIREVVPGAMRLMPHGRPVEINTSQIASSGKENDLILP